MFLIRNNLPFSCPSSLCATNRLVSNFSVTLKMETLSPVGYRDVPIIFYGDILKIKVIIIRYANVCQITV